MTTSLLVLSVMAAVTLPVAAAAMDCFDGTSPFDVKGWTYCQKINEELFMYYDPFQEEERGNLMIGLHAPNHYDGWSSLALGGNGGMKGASQIVVRKDEDGEWTAEDRYSLDYVTPSLDESQDVQLLFAEQSDDTGTSWGVRMKMNSCDEYDYAVEDLDRFMLWALGSSHDFFYHGENRGQFHANLMQPPKEEEPVDGLEFIDFSMSSVDIVAPGGKDPNNPYICSVFDLNVVKDGFDADQDKMHAVRFSPNLDPATSQYVHHMILYACDPGVTLFSHGEVIPDCESMPAGCTNTKWSWALGAEDIVFPEDVGMPFGEGERILILQTHYYNPRLDTGLVDSSGVRNYLAPELRPIDADYFRVARAVNPLTEPGTIPPGVTDFALSSMYVPSDCTDTWEEPLNVMYVGYHAHLIGTHVQLDVYRDGKNIGPMRIQNRYDFAHQSVEPTRIQTVFPGDEFRLTCAYDSTSRTEPTGFGERSQDEMCLAGFIYYPRQQNTLAANLPIPDNMNLCTIPGTDDHADVSACAQSFLENVPEFFGFEDMFPIPIGGTTFCNSALKLDFGLEVELCPPCGEDSSCTEDSMKAWAQNEVCPFWCGNVGLPVYPDIASMVTRTTNNETQVGDLIFCGNEIMRTVDVEMPPPVCEPMGDLDVISDGEESPDDSAAVTVVWSTTTALLLMTMPIAVMVFGVVV